MSTFINEAFFIASMAHMGQMRKYGNIPYIIHPLRVADHIGGIDEVLTASAILHDAFEDAPSDRIEIIKEQVSNLSIKVFSIVNELTFDGNDKDAYMSSFATKSIESLIIKLFDRYDNIMDFSKKAPEYAPKYAEKARNMTLIVNNRTYEIMNQYGLSFASKVTNVATTIRQIGIKSYERSERVGSDALSMASSC
jgi:(p)ppGpp synthase/HD superfamily hydrolase